MTCPDGHKHGATRTCYVRHGCRCESCTATNRADQTRRRQAARRARAAAAQRTPAVTTVDGMVQLLVSPKDAQMVSNAIQDRAQHLAMFARTAGVQAPLIRERVRTMRALVEQLRAGADQ